MIKIKYILFACFFMFIMGAQKNCASDEQIEDCKNSEECSLGCKEDADCGLIKADCCGCSQGMAQKAILKSQIKEEEAAFKKQCKDIMCPQVISEDESCKKKAVCKQGKCELDY